MPADEGKRTLPDLPSTENLRKQAKERLAELRAKTPSVRLTHAQFILAREYGFADWRAMLAEVARRLNNLKGLRARILRLPKAVPRSAPAEEPDDMPMTGMRAMALAGYILVVLIGIGLSLFGALKYH
jgi:hypothetical protein